MIKPGVATGKEVQEIFNLAKEKAICNPCCKRSWF